ncbi:MAG: hypothetical protein F7C38_00815 [Desulfurococcales archaeon]|nr:hypothetical protein [Desulfurococcales archaeon]
MQYASMAGYIDGVIVEANVAGMPAFYLVKGYAHPEHHLVVQPYRYPDCRRNPPAHIYYNRCLGVETTMVPRVRILRTIRPEAAVKVLPERVKPRIQELIEVLGLEWYGVTGSYALNCEGPSSDVDVLGLYRPGLLGALWDLARDGLIRQCKRRDVLAKRSRGPGGLALEASRIEESLVDSCYRGQPYTLRLVTSIWEEPCDRALIPYGYVELAGWMKPLGEPITVPTRYRIDTGSATVIVETWRTRYQEIKEGRYRVKGLLRLDVASGDLILWPDMGGWIAEA